MDRIQTPSPAEQTPVSTEKIRSLREKIAALERAQQTISKRAATVRSELAPLLEQQKKRDAASRAADPVESDDFLGDPSYENDYSFEASAEDRRSLEAAIQREYYYDNNPSIIRDTTASIADEEAFVRNAEALKAELQAEIDRINNSVLLSMFDARGRKREALRVRLAAANDRQKKAPAIIEKWKRELEEAKERAPTLFRAKQYDVKLHDLKAEALLPRSNQVVAISIDFRRERNTVTIRMPSTPGEKDFTQVVTFELRDFDTEYLGKIIGRDLSNLETTPFSIGEAVDYNQDFENELVPFALEVVEVDGKQMLRLPQLVWEQFGDSVSQR